LGTVVGGRGQGTGPGQEAAKRRRPHMSTNNATMVARMVTWSTANAGKEVACAHRER